MWSNWQNFNRAIIKLKTKTKWFNFLIIILSATIFGLSFNLPIIGLPVSLLALIPLFWVLNQPKITPLKTSFSNFSYFFVFYLFAHPWYFTVLPLNWSGVISNQITEYFLVSLVLIISSLAFSLPFLLSGHLYFYLKSKSDLANILILTSLLTLSFWLSAFLASLVFLGTETLIGSHFTIGNIGYILADHSFFRLLASVAGLYGLTALVISLNLIFFYLFKKSRWQLVLIIITLIFISQFITLPRLTTNQSIKTAIITTDYADKEIYFDEKPKIIFTDLAQKIEFLLQQFPSLELIVIPEDSRLFVSGTKITNDHPLDLDVLHFQSILINKNVTLIDSARLYLPDHDNAQTIIMALNTKNMTTDFSYKSLLAPVGEYIPYSLSYILKTLGYDQELQNYHQKRGVVSGKPTLITADKNYQLGVLLCSEIISPYLYRDLTKAGASILINPSSLSLFNNSNSISLMTKRMAQIRAIENNRYLIISANSSTSYVISQTGQVLSKNKNPNNYIVYDIPIIKSKTLYNLSGDWILILLSIIVFIVLNNKIMKKI